MVFAPVKAVLRLGTLGTRFVVGFVIATDPSYLELFEENQLRFRH